MKCLLVIDMQNDFLTGALGTAEGAGIVGDVCSLISGFEGKVFYTRDTHGEDYLTTREGRNLPVPHCLKDTEGWQICEQVGHLIRAEDRVVDKVTFGEIRLPEIIREECGGGPEEIHLAGVCTDICVISNAMICRAAFPEIPVLVHADCCAGVTPESHRTALEAMRACHIDII